MSTRFAGKVALLTGAASGIGRATVLRLASEGAAIFAHDVDADGLDATRRDAEALGAKVATRAGDLTSPDECRETVAACVATFGRLDVLGNIAGLSWGAHFTEVGEADYRRMMAVNVDACFFLAQAAVPHLLETAGNIVNIASNTGLMGGAYLVAYCMTKGAVIQMTKALAMEYMKTPLRVNAIAPGGVATALTAGFRLPPDADGQLVARYMTPRPMADPDEVAALFAFVASDEARSIHGAILSIDNGLTAG